MVERAVYCVVLYELGGPQMGLTEGLLLRTILVPYILIAIPIATYLSFFSFSFSFSSLEIL